LSCRFIPRNDAGSFLTSQSLGDGG